ncbi:hypothetical protein OU792_10185 [Algoriphagus sp. NF]|uniref:hypothetical protein n=1 Tax=Algoriphagus sp. NF TaxID=2992756 RepID=UPI00237BB38E|nr:hypothetical protein [Algoriphagus sp. NF]MDE0560354.1 hypothetical protein [Algoriphagus sp. NF]
MNCGIFEHASRITLCACLPWQEIHLSSVGEISLAPVCCGRKHTAGEIRFQRNRLREIRIAKYTFGEIGCAPKGPGWKYNFLPSMK